MVVLGGPFRPLWLGFQQLYNIRWDVGMLGFLDPLPPRFPVENMILGPEMGPVVQYSCTSENNHHYFDRLLYSGG